MTEPSVLLRPRPDRRGAIKARHRQAIVTAARQLIDEQHGPRFSVDELATRADVSRRTVFNHFESLDDVIVAACSEVLDAVVASFREAATATPAAADAAVAGGTLGSVFDEIAAAVLATDLPQITAYLWQALGGADAPASRQQRFMQVALSRVADDLTHEVVEHNPAVDPLDIELLVSSLLNGVAVVARLWVERFGGSDDSEARDAWDQLMHRLVTRLRTGYAPSPPA